MIFEKVTKKDPRRGDTRVLELYALLPTTVTHQGKDVIVLFEKYYEHQKYELVIDTWSSGNRWVTTQKTLHR